MHSLVSTLTDLGIAAGAIVAIVAAFRLIPGVDRPIRYLFRVLIGDPLSTWAHSIVMPIVTEALEPFGRRLDSIDGAVNNRPPGSPTLSQDVVEIRERQAVIDDRLAADHERLRAIEDVVTSPPKKDE